MIHCVYQVNTIMNKYENCSNNNKDITIGQVSFA